MSVLDYTMQHLFSEQAVLQRNEAVYDAGGARQRTNWQYLDTVPCRVWWDQVSSRSPNREWVSPARTAPLAEGGVLLPAGTDVTVDDRITEILDRAGNTIMSGDFEIVSVVNQDTQHIELSIKLARTDGA